MRKTFLAICVAALSLLAVSSCGKLEDSINKLEQDLGSLTERVDDLEKKLNDDIANLSTLQGKVNDLETSLKKLIADGDAAVKAALQQAFDEALAKVKSDLEKAIADGDAELQAALKKEVESLTAAIGKLEGDVATLKTDVATVQTAVTTLEKTLGANYQELLAKMDQADKVLDGKITDHAAALEVVKKAYADADTKLKETVSAEMVAKIAEALLKVTVQKVEEVDGVIVLTLADGTTVKLSKPLENVDNEGLVTTVVVDGVKYWAVIVNGEAQSLNIPVGADTQLEFKVEEGELYYSLNGGEWVSTGAYVADGQENLFSSFYQGETGEYEWDEDYNLVPVLEDFYTLVYGGSEYYLPIYKADNSVVTIKAGKTYFTYGEIKTIDVALADITSVYVMSKPDGWRANLDGKKLTVTAPKEEAVTAGYAEADGEVLLHCTTAEGKCKIAKLAVATSEGFSLTVDAEGNVKIVNPVVVTTVNTMMGWETTDFNDAYVGLAPIADFEANPAEYVTNAPSGYINIAFMISGWKNNTMDWETGEFTIGGMYEPGVYEVDVIESTVADMYYCNTYSELPRGSQFVVWACPVDDMGMPNVDDLVYGYYAPVEVEAAVVGDPIFNDATVSTVMYGAKSYYIGKASEEEIYDWMSDSYDIEKYIMGGISAFAAGYSQINAMEVVQSGEFEYNLSEVVSEYEEPSKLSPNTKYYFYVIPVIEGKEWNEYTFEDVAVCELTTAALAAGGSATVSYSNAVAGFTELAVDITGSEGTSMIYYNFYDKDVLNEMGSEDVVADLVANGYVAAGNSATARDNYLEPGQVRVLVAIAVDSEGKYGEVVEQDFETKTITYSDTFKATIGDPVITSYEQWGSTYYNASIPVTVEGGTAAKYYYYWSTTARTEDVLKENLPLGTYPYTSAEILPETLACSTFYAPYQFAVVVESETGELSYPVWITVEKPVVEETPAE